VWLPTWHQARLVCRQLGIADDIDPKSLEGVDVLAPVDELLHLYRRIVDTLKQGEL